MPTDSERITACESSIIKLAANKLDTVDLSTTLTNLNTAITDLQSAVNNLLARVEAIELYIMNEVQAS